MENKYILCANIERGHLLQTRIYVDPNAILGKARIYVDPKAILGKATWS